MKIYIVLIFWWLPSTKLEETTVLPDGRKVYGLNFNNGCGDYIVTFKCMTACQSKGYGIFRVSSTCECTCHDISTSTVLPYFQWRTTRPTRGIPHTQSVSLYHIVGSLSPQPHTGSTRGTDKAIEYSCVPITTNNYTVPANGTDSVNATTPSGFGNETTTLDGDKPTDDGGKPTGAEDKPDAPPVTGGGDAPTAEPAPAPDDPAPDAPDAPEEE